MSIIERRRVLSIGLYCAMTILTLSAGMQPATARALIGAAAPMSARAVAGCMPALRVRTVIAQ